LDSEVCVWVTMEGEAAVELGATVPISLIEAVPADAEMVWPPEPLATVALPAEARTTLGIDHLGINWEAHGHPPSPFMAPHFDFHFYNLSPSDVRAIDCSDETKPLRVPARHTLPDVDVPGLGVLVGLCVPQMGMHAMHNGLVDGTEAFEASLVLGYYGGEPVFFEPMISRERLLERTGFALDVPAVEGLPDGVHYPRQFHAEYDAEEEVYRMTFTDFR
ncbi:MAG: hypothetical protein ACC682_11450, partial [Gemmatimonadota bacterium]